jgi:ComEC/Rec2-related protein
MFLFFSLTILLFIFSLFRISIYNGLKPVADMAHQFCLSRLPQDSLSLSELKALVCAENFSNLNQSQFYISSGLIHLFVVSGAHFLLIEQVLYKLTLGKKWPSVFVFVVLLSYGLMCGLNPPVCRCLFSFAISHYLFSKNIRWPFHFKILIIGSVTLSSHPDWINSLSLQMSWLAAFAVSFSQEYFKNSSIVLKQILFFTILLPTLVNFQDLNFSSILANVFLAPVLEFILFPLALLVWFLNFLDPIFHFIIKNFGELLRLFEFEYSPRLTVIPPELAFWNWGLIFFLHFSTHLYFIQIRRKLLEVGKS